jgi:hypothetical protein
MKQHAPHCVWPVVELVLLPLVQALQVDALAPAVRTAGENVLTGHGLGEAVVLLNKKPSRTNPATSDR